MAGLSTDPNGSKRIQVYVDGSRKTIRLGKIPRNQAETIRAHVAQLAAAQIDGSVPPPKTSQWLADVSVKLRTRLAKAGLCTPPQQRTVYTIGSLVKAYRESKWAQYQEGTIQIQELTITNLLEYIGGDQDLTTLTEGDAEDFRDALLNKHGLAESTTRKRCAIASKFMRFAMRRKWMEANPFEEVAKGNLAADTFRFVTASEAQAVLEQLPGTEWKLLFALSRWGGLRVGSEPRQLRIGHVDWERDRITVPSPKTKRYQGHAERVVPLFPELLPHLLARCEELQEGEELLLPMLVGRTDASLRKTLLKAIKTAEVPSWPRLWHNLRATRQTELEDSGFPTHVVCKWMGNSKATAHKHYLKTLDDHFAKAAGKMAPKETRQPASTPDDQRQESEVSS